MSSADVAVYIPVYNGERYLGDCLRGVLAQTHPVADLVVIDDGSTDRSARIATELGVRVITQPGNCGLSMGRRRAFEEITCPLIASLDVDCVPDPEWLGILVRELENPVVAGAAGKLLEFHQDTAVDRWRARHMIQHWGNVRLVSPLMLFGNNNVFRREAVLRVGNYPTAAEYHTNNEDYYISRRLREWGYRIIYNPAAIVHHHRRDTVQSLFRTYWNWFLLHRPRPDSRRGLWRKSLDNISWTAKFLKQDRKAGDGELARLSVRFMYEQSRLDMKYYFKR
ncbi:glycosyltransferase family 2 protein [bacterium]|nr:glycosyltransferase family 2 protein [candidate division CSSED10-310 bacterium]